MKWLIAMIGLLIAIVIAVGVVSIRGYARFDKACSARGGIPIYTRNDELCLSHSSVIEVQK